MYEKILKNVEAVIKQESNFNKIEDIPDITLSMHLDLIIKIKTIQAMDVSAELIRESRRISRN